MANYGDFDGALDGSTVPYGIDEYTDPNARRNTIRENLWATNRGVYGIIGSVNKLAGAISDAANSVIGSVPDKVVENLLNRRWPWWNQEEVAPEHQGMNNIVENLFATNGRVYHPQYGNKALSDKLDLLVQLRQVTSDGEVARLVKEYNDSHVAKVPVVEKLPVTKPVDGTNPPSPKGNV